MSPAVRTRVQNIYVHTCVYMNMDSCSRVHVYTCVYIYANVMVVLTLLWNIEPPGFGVGVCMEQAYQRLAVCGSWMAAVTWIVLLCVILAHQDDSFCTGS